MWSARISITDAEMTPGVVVKKRKPYIKTIEQESDTTIKDYVLVERLQLHRDTPIVIKTIKQ